MKTYFQIRSAEAVMRDAGIRTDVAPGQKLTIVQGEVVRVNFAFEYRGPAQYVYPYASIGKLTVVIFDEIASARGLRISLAESGDFVTYSGYVDIDSSPAKPEANYDLMSKLVEYPGQTEVRLSNVIDVLGSMAFQGFEITGYDIV